MTALFVVLIFLYATLAIYFAFKDNYQTVEFFLLADCVQNIIAIVFYNNGVSGSLITIYTAIKEMMIYLAVLLYFLKRRRIRVGKLGALAILYFALILFNALRSSVLISAVIASIRTLLLPVIFIVFGYTLSESNKSELKVNSAVIRTSIILSILAIVEYFALGDSFWRSIGYTKYITTYRVMSTWTYHGVSINFYTWDFGFPLRRFVSIMADPLATAYLIFLGLTLLWFRCENRITNSRGLRRLVETALFVTSILYFSKGIYVCIIVCLLTLYLFKSEYRFHRLKTPITILLFLALAVVVYFGFSGRYGNSSSANHFNGLFDALKNGGILGKGLGSAGINAAASGAEVDVGESYIGTIIYQLGYIGLFIFLIMYANILQQSIFIWRKTRGNFAKHSIYILIAIFLCMLFSESSCSVSGTGIYFIVIGMSFKIGKYQIVEGRKNDNNTNTI